MRRYFVLLFLTVTWVLMGTTIEVDLNGNHDHLTIQAGIDAASDGDIVLVYPGRYFENIDFSGKTITVASLEMTTGERQYIHSTIIDGNQNGSCVTVNNEEEEGTEIRGFTITNGSGSYFFYTYLGGGIFVYDSCLRVLNSIIENNSAATSGAGLAVSGSIFYIEGCIVRNNYARMSGGGMAIGRLNQPIEFSEQNRCSVYDNYATLGSDIYNGVTDDAGCLIDVIVDTFTVENPFGYEFYQGDGSYNQNYDDSVFDMQHARYGNIEADLYVSTEGDDENSGLSAEDPFKTIWHALTVIEADENNPHTIYIADGIYSTTLNQDYFPVSMRAHVSLVGESEENTIIDLGEGHKGGIVDMFTDLNYQIKNLTIRNCYVLPSEMVLANPIYILNITESENPVLIENVTLQNNDQYITLLNGYTNLTLRNVSFIENTWNYGTLTSCAAISYDLYYPLQREVLIENCRFNQGERGGLYITNVTSTDPDDTKINIVNCEFSENKFHCGEPMNYTVGISISTNGVMDMKLINCDFADNYLFGNYQTESAPIRIKYGLIATVINCIFYNNDTSHEIILDGMSIDFPPPELYIHHCIVENGLDGLYAIGNYELDWEEERVWGFDPLFTGEEEYPYKLQEGSFAIDMGDMELPAGIELPEYDLAGNQRIRGSRVDLGCYEYNPYSSPSEETDLFKYSSLTIYPNPLNASNLRNGYADIVWKSEENLKSVHCDIFNLKGQKVRSGIEMDKTDQYNFSAKWDLRNNQGNLAACGIYFIRVKADNYYLDQQKAVVIK